MTAIGITPNVVELGRRMCLRCRRPAEVCWCGQVTPIASLTHVVFLQHPRESRVPVSTCRMAHLSLPNSELHVGLKAEGNARLEQLVQEEGTAVLFPGPDAVPVEQLQVPLKTLVVVDGTWSNARKVVERSPLLKALPRVSLNPDRPGNYRIRREPAAHCLATIEAVAQVLEKLEQAPGRFTPMLSAFDRMVELQLAHVHAGLGDPRSKRPRHRNTKKRDFALPLKEQADTVVVAYAEANGWPVGSAVPGRAELVQLIAVRPSTGEQFVANIVPRRPLSPNVPVHLGLSAEQLLAGEPLTAALARFAAFRRGGLLATWGRYTADLLRFEGVDPGETIDLKHAASQVLFRPSGGAEALAQALGWHAPAGPRSHRRLAAMQVVTGALVNGALARLRSGGAAEPPAVTVAATANG